ncbi:5'-nucleotidase [Acidiphilium sp. C61]|uniref:5'-nucleotidase n=1 Tax=Acidiphilium sp. C61 TaxID=1671485 RepID=UPI00157A6C51|nr:5'-nucleotidase [Acidiphilium sp. C61]
MTTSPDGQQTVALPLVVGVSTRAMFDLTEEHDVFTQRGVEAYAQLQRERERVPLKPGAAFEVTRRLLALNAEGPAPMVKVILLSRNSPDLSLRAFNSFEHYELSVQHGSFTSGRTVAPFVAAWGIDLFLSNADDDVQSAITAGTAAARLGPTPGAASGEDDRAPKDEVRIALDGDAVLFSEASDRIYRDHGLNQFLEHERANAHIPMERGPFGRTFFPKLALIRQAFMRDDGTSRVRLSIVTARNAPAHERVIHTLRAWGTPADEAHFVGRHAKGPFLRACRAHIFFDDQETHVVGASDYVPSGLVPGPHSPEDPVIPAG